MCSGLLWYKDGLLKLCESFTFQKSPSLSLFLFPSSSLAKLTEQLQATQGRSAYCSVQLLFITVYMLSVVLELL